MYRQFCTSCVIAAALTLCGCGGAPVETAPHVRTLSREVGPDPNFTTLERTPQQTAEPTIGGYVIPYDTSRVISDHWSCRSNRRRHRGIDIAGVGQNAGLGAPVVSMARARITHLGSPEMDAGRYGRRLTDRASVVRGGETLPTRGQVPGYGTVSFFTENYGSWHTGVIVSTLVLDGELAGHEVRYMHLAAFEPSLRVGSVVQPGQELGIMGGTAILESTPHVHMDAEDADGRRIDLARFLGLPVRDPHSVPDC